MPYSSTEGKQLVVSYFSDKQVNIVLDIGPGAGTYRDILGPVISPSHWIGVEIWAPYVTQFQLEQKYDEIIIADAYYLNWNLIGFPSLTILGDVLEHMDKATAKSVLEKAVSRSQYVIVSMPIIHYPQGAEMGNPWETHVHHWTDKTIREELLDEYDILAYDIGDVVGTYIIGGDQL